MPKTLKEIADFVQGQARGDAKAMIHNVAGIQDAREGDITFLANPKYLGFAAKTAASAIIVGRGLDIPEDKNVIFCDNPSLAFTKAVEYILPNTQRHPCGVSRQAKLAKKVTLGKSVAVGAYSVIEEGVSIGDYTVIYPGCFIGGNTVIGKHSVVYPNVCIRENITIGSNVIIHPGAVIGSDGFGFVTVDGLHHKIPQVGTVVVEDDVEIGANVTIDRARFDKTIIGQGTKIDNLVHIAHNVIVGKNCLIVAQVGISGSTSLGNNVILAGQVGVVGHVTIGDDTVVMAQSGVSKSLAAGSIVFGTPAAPADQAKKVHAYTNALPRLHETIKDLKIRVEQLEKR